jgi:anti-anti-sigma regulatory factor
MHLTPCPQCGSRSLAAGSVCGFSLRVRKVMVVEPPPAAELASAFFRGLASHLRAESCLIIDLSRAIMDSVAIGQLALLHKKAKSERTIVKLILPDDSPIREMFRATRLDMIFSICPTMDSALDTLR